MLEWPPDLFALTDLVLQRLGGPSLRAVSAAWREVARIALRTEGGAETIAFAEGIGVDPADFLEAIGGGPLDLPWGSAVAEAGHSWSAWVQDHSLPIPELALTSGPYFARRETCRFRASAKGRTGACAKRF